MAYLVRCPACHTSRRIDDPPTGKLKSFFVGDTVVPCTCGMRYYARAPREGVKLGYSYLRG